MAGESRYLAIGEESDFGILAQPVLFLDYLSTSLEAPTDSLIFYEGASSRANSIAVSGPYIPSGDIELGVDPIAAIHFLKWALGRYGHTGTTVSPAVETTLDGAASAGVTTVTVEDATSLAIDDYIQIGGGIGGDVSKVTAVNSNVLTLELSLLHPHLDNADVTKVESPFTHIFAPTLEDSLPSFTARIGKGVFEHVFAGATIDRLRFSVDRGFLTCGASIQAQKDSYAAINSGGKTFPGTLYTSRHAATLISNFDESVSVESFELEIGNNVVAEAGIRFGSRFPREFPIEGLEISGSMTLAFQSLDEYERFWGASSGVQEAGGSTLRVEQQFRSGDNWLKFVMASAYWTQVSTPVSGRGRITQSVQFASVVDPVWGAINVEVINTKYRY